MTVSPAALGPLRPLPAQPFGVPWPSDHWPVGALPDGVELDGLMDAAFDPDGPLQDTYAVACVLGGRLVHERYGGTLPRFDGPGRPVTVDTPPLWSVAKSLLHAVVGMLVMDGVLDPADRANVPAWHGAGDRGGTSRWATCSPPGTATRPAPP